MIGQRPFVSLKLLALLPLLSTLTPVSPALAAANETITPTTGRPGLNVQVSGTGFLASEAVDVYFDTTDEFLAFTNSSGNFAAHQLTVPASASPGTHWITAIGRNDGGGTQKSFVVRTAWPGLGFNLYSARDNRFENVLSPSNVSALDLAWTATAGTGIGRSSPAVVNGTVYIGSTNHRLYAFNASTGALRWSFATSNAINSSPAVSGGVVYFGSADKHIYAVTATTGVLKWKATTGGAVDSSPAIANGLVYVGSSDSNVYALNAATGATVWITSVGATSSSPAVYNGAVYIGSSDGNLHALDANTGDPLWAAPTGDTSLSSPSIANGTVITGSKSGYVYGFDALTGLQQWNFPFDGLETTPAIANGIFYIAASGGLYAHKVSTGELLWPAGVGTTGLSSAGIANGVLYIGTDDNNLYAFDPNTGAYLWSATTGSAVDSSPAVTDGMVYVGSSDGTLYAYALNGGQNPIYKHSTAPPSYSTLHPDFRLKPR